MKEEDIDRRIERVINKLAPKRAEMVEWDKARIRREQSRRKWIRYGIPAAASVLIVCGVGFGILFTHHDSQSVVFGSLQTTSPHITFRGGASSEEQIIALLDSCKYAEALQIVNEELADTVIPSDYTAERHDYMVELQEYRTYQLTWLKIEIFLKTNKLDEAKEILSTYRHLEGEHQDEAAKIYKELCRYYI